MNMKSQNCVKKDVGVIVQTSIEGASFCEKLLHDKGAQQGSNLGSLS